MWARYITLAVPPPTWVYKWILAILRLSSDPVFTTTTTITATTHLTPPFRNYSRLYNAEGIDNYGNQHKPQWST